MAQALKNGQHDMVDFFTCRPNLNPLDIYSVPGCSLCALLGNDQEQSTYLTRTFMHDHIELEQVLGVYSFNFYELIVPLDVSVILGVYSFNFYTLSIS